MSENLDKFIDAIDASLKNSTFVKLTLGNYKGIDEHLQKILVRLVSTKKGTRLFFLYRSETRDTAKNYDLNTGVGLISEALDNGFKSGHLFTTENDYQLDIGKKNKSRLNVAKPTFPTAPIQEHNRDKTAQIDSDSSYLKALGVTDDNGRIRDRQQDKWRQINKFVEILASLVDKSELNDETKLRIVDMGSGKGYLTFAAYDYFKNTRNIDVQMTGVDAKSNLVDLCNGIATACQFDGLDFVVGSIGDYEIGDVVIMFDLHVCITATEDAMFKGMTAKYVLIFASQCFVQ